MNSKTDALTRERWVKMEELFDAALELAPEARGVFLRTACDGDDDLRREVEALIAANETGGRRVEGLIRDTAGKALTKSVTGGDNMIGPYRVIETIGQGGMGAVYLAERVDHEFEQQVAIKLLHKTLVTPDLQRRFRSERQILADLNHPNIAHLIDGGSTDDGVPYLVMEYVEGQPIDVYCDQNDLSVRRRLELFRQICSAVEVAHQNLIVHRDIKPGNILVTKDGTPKLLDFGIAKILSSKTDSAVLDLTQMGDRLLTPDHASPEQILGKPVTTASDVYSLGVLLYELLCGNRPFKVNSLSPSQMEHTICHTQPEPPSRAVGSEPTAQGERQQVDSGVIAVHRGVTPDRLRRQLRGDLDKIVLYSLRKEPDRRYRSVGLMSEDIRRHLRGLPVTAQRDTFSYRTGKFIRRNGVAVAFAFASALFLAGFSVVTFVQAKRIAHERDVASASMSFLIDTIDSVDPEERLGDELTARQIFDLAALRARTEFDEQPEVQMFLQHAIARIYLSLGKLDEALASAENSRATREQLEGDTSATLVPTINLIGNILRAKGDWQQSEQAHRRALLIATKRHSAVHPDIAASQFRLADTLRENDKMDEAIDFYSRSLAGYTALGAQYDEQRAEALASLGTLRRQIGNLDDAERLFREALTIRRAMHGPNHPDTALLLENLAIVAQVRGDTQMAGSLMAEALAVLQRVYPGDHPTVSLSMLNVGRNLALNERYAEAEKIYREAMQMETRMRGPDHQWTAFAAYELARAVRRQGRLHEAEALLLNVIEVYRKTLGESHSLLATALRHLGDLQRELGRPREAIETLDKSLAIARATFDADHWTIGANLSNLGAAYAALGDCGTARTMLEEGGAMLSANLGAEHRLTVRNNDRLAALPSHANCEGPSTQ